MHHFYVPSERPEMEQDHRQIVAIITKQTKFKIP